MNSLYTLMVAVQVVMALIIIGLVLMQHGKGADMGAAFGSGASGSLFGATGSSSFLSKATGIAATIFFCATLGLAYLGNQHTAPATGVMSNLPVTQASEIPTTQPIPTDVPAPASTPSSSKQSDQIPK